MKIEQLDLIRQSLIHIHPIADQIAKSFYARLFEVTPHLQRLFTGDMHRQGAMLMTSLELAVSNLDNHESILPAIQALGERHVSYGVKAEYYPLAREAYLWALEKQLGEKFTPALQEAWETAFDALTEAMIRVTDS
ncbi:MAG TPA: globin domain-containing protein [Anaerolineales bacterium]|nr:globin domain-containing protein [Anaerolineales bacterium]